MLNQNAKGEELDHAAGFAQAYKQPPSLKPINMKLVHSLLIAR
jgi:hypothetical protein